MTKAEYDKNYRSKHGRKVSSDLPVRLKMGTLRCDCGLRAIEVSDGSGRCARCRQLEMNNERIKTQNNQRKLWRARWSRWFNEPVEVSHE